MTLFTKTIEGERLSAKFRNGRKISRGGWETYEDVGDERFSLLSSRMSFVIFGKDNESFDCFPSREIRGTDGSRL